MLSRANGHKQRGSVPSAQSEDIVDNMAPREAIGRAVELLQAEHGVSESGAFKMLVQGSSDSHEKVREVAAAIVRRSLT